MRTVAALMGMLSLVCGITFVASPAQAAPARKTVYLTFDDGPHSKWTPRYLDVLKKNGAKGTFFTTGRNVKAYPGIVARIDREGHLLANHTWSHPNLTKLSKAQVKSQLTRTQSALGSHRSDCMRPPYGATSTAVRRWTKEVGLRTVLWDVDSRDWENSQTSSRIYHRVLKNVRNGSVVLMHDGGDSQADSLAALKRLLPKLKSQGYTFKILPNC
ncbi:polysaccharide deacetylase family protein [Actinoplanes sp. NPDC023801]|uniref:polysaccharide deacetylase family protein n=1 Tax=Actinoplanes sp. NPDC023801 TaxID=3154595 RepID=UPI0033E55585